MTGQPTLPPIGLGTYSDANREQWIENVELALDAGYRHVDTAQIYGNEAAVGEGIRRSPVDREDVFLATKTVHHDVPERPEDVEAAIDGCLERLGVETVDLLYVHWPTGLYEHEAILPRFEAAREAGTIRHIGLSNFTPELLEEALAVLDAPLLAHQVEMHPLCQQDDLLAHAREHDYRLVAYSPLAKGEVFEVPVLAEIAEAHDATPAQVSLAWLREKGVTPIPKASSEAHMRANLSAMDLDLDAEAVARIDAIDREYRVIDPDRAPWNQ